MSASRPFSVIFSGLFKSPSANIACPAASAWATLAPPPGAMKPGTLTPSASKNFFSLATRCWPYTKVETLGVRAVGRAARGERDARGPGRPEKAATGESHGDRVYAGPSPAVNRNILTLQAISP